MLWWEIYKSEAIESEKLIILMRNKNIHFSNWVKRKISFWIRNPSLGLKFFLESNELSFFYFSQRTSFPWKHSLVVFSYIHFFFQRVHLWGYKESDKDFNSTQNISTISKEYHWTGLYPFNYFSYKYYEKWSVKKARSHSLSWTLPPTPTMHSEK